MRFALTPDQEDLRDLVHTLLARECPPQLIRSAPDGPGLAALWKQLAQVDVLGLLVSVEQGGLGLDEVALAVMMIEAGRVALPVPLLEAVTWAAPLLAGQEPLASAVLRGEATVAVDPAGAGRYPHGRHATHLLSGGRAGAGEGRLGLLGAHEHEPVATLDPTRGMVRRTGPAGEVVAVGAPVELAWQRAVLGASAELVGLGGAMLDIAVRHVRDRHQFGAPVGSFQAVSHRLADALLALEFAEPVVLAAGNALAVGTPGDASVAVSMAKAQASTAASLVARVALQSLGALGYTIEHDLHLYLKRTWALAEAWGGAGWHRARVAEHLGLLPPTVEEVHP